MSEKATWKETLASICIAGVCGLMFAGGCLAAILLATGGF